MIYYGTFSYNGKRVKRFEYSFDFLNALNNALSLEDVCVKYHEVKIFGKLHLFFMGEDTRLITRPNFSKADILVKKLHNLFRKKVIKISSPDNDQLLECFNQAVLQINFIEKYYKEFNSVFKNTISIEEFASGFRNLSGESFENLQNNEEESESPTTAIGWARWVLDNGKDPYEFYGKYTGVDYLMLFDENLEENFNDNQDESDSEPYSVQWFEETILNTKIGLKDYIEDSKIRRYLRFPETKINKIAYKNDSFLGLINDGEFLKIFNNYLNSNLDLTYSGLVLKLSLVNFLSDTMFFIVDWLSILTLEKTDLDDIFKEENLKYIYQALEHYSGQVLNKILNLIKATNFNLKILQNADQKIQNQFFDLMNHKEEFLEFVDAIFAKFKYQK